MFGEHSVVYGRPAVATSLSHGAKATLSTDEPPGVRIRHPGGVFHEDERVQRALRGLLAIFELRVDELCIDVELKIPVGVGLGSSAALAVAVARAAARLTGQPPHDQQDRIQRAVDASETVFHGTPSGIDRRAAMGKGFFSFVPPHGTPARVQPLQVPPHPWLVARVDSPSSTERMVSSVRQLHQRLGEFAEALFDDFASVARRGARALGAGDWKTVGKLMNVNQGLLDAIGVSTPRLGAACHAARDAGAWGAKLTGAGGGGCIVALPASDRLEAVRKTLEDHGEVYQFRLPPGM